MSTPYDDFSTWFQGASGAAQYTRARGTWVEPPTGSPDTRFAVFQFQGGAKPDVDMISPVVDVTILGKRGERNVAGSLPDIENFVYDLVARSMSSTCSGKITGIRAIGLPSGPFYTTEDRPWYKISFELTGVALSG